MAGGFKIGTNGRVCLNSSGQAVKCDCGGCSQCNPGTDSSPTATATIANVTDGSGCLLATRANDGTAIAYSFKTSSNINGTQTLDLAPGNAACVWASGDLSGIVIDVYLNSSCSGLPSTPTDYEIGLYKISGFWKLVITNQVIVSAPGAGGSSGTNNYAFFVGTIPVSSNVDCNVPLGFSNDLTSTGASYFDSFFGWLTPLASGGTVTVTFP